MARGVEHKKRAKNHVYREVSVCGLAAIVGEMMMACRGGYVRPMKWRREARRVEMRHGIRKAAERRACARCRARCLRSDVRLALAEAKRDYSAWGEASIVPTRNAARQAHRDGDPLAASYATRSA